jgi:hypothetical protein
MTFLSASEDFLGRTLAALPGAWGKLQYVSGLRTEDGHYDHWGLTRLHGEAAVQRALGEVHRDTFLGILRTPLARLLEDAHLSAAKQELEAAPYLQELRARSKVLLPPDLGGGMEPHFSSVLTALLKLAQARSSATRQAA